MLGVCLIAGAVGDNPTASWEAQAVIGGLGCVSLIVGAWILTMPERRLK